MVNLYVYRLRCVSYDRIYFRHRSLKIIKYFYSIFYQHLKILIIREGYHGNFCSHSQGQVPSIAVDITRIVVGTIQ